MTLGMCILLGFVMKDVLRGENLFIKNSVALLLIYTLLVPAHPFYNSLKYFKINDPTLNPWSSLEIYNRITEILKEAEGDVLVEYASFAIKSGKKVLLQPHVVTVLYRSEKLNMEKLANDLKDAKFSYIIHKLFMKRATGKWLNENYYLSERLEEKYVSVCGRGPWLIYKRKKFVAEEGKNVFYLSDLRPIFAMQDTGTLGFDKTYQRKKIQLDGNEYAKGLGTHSNSEIIYSTKGNFSEFRATIGVDDELDKIKPNHASVIFKVYLDESPVFESGIFYQDTPPKEINISLRDTDKITLIVTDAGQGAPNGNLLWGDHADWAAARFIK
ncbi:MAG: NPCBM/NEW2 domain-containing protein [Candidatus Omnitrophica bacterium]|nr:NPCBM/NEW2 domain-containing protein [Candidatus Omnitrophota bacterium]